MRYLTLSKGGLNKCRSHHKELKQADLEDSIKSIPPGDWCAFVHPSFPGLYIGFVNSMIDERYPCIQLVATLEDKNLNAFNVENFIESMLEKAHTKRTQFKGYDDASRIFFGAADGLPGLIIDKFRDKAIIQINTAGIDRYRDLVKVKVESLISGKAYFLDNPKYREKEFLPTFESIALPDLDFLENGIKFHIRSEVLQKVGFYYDHRENRNFLIHLLGRLNKNFVSGADLFCYAGAWGLGALKAGCAEMIFVDQGDFETEINTNLEINEFQGRGKFYRSDVFKFLDEQIAIKKCFDLILCDPPAFAKSLNQKNQALEGYSKLHRKVLKAGSPGALIVFSSCTHYVTNDEFQKNILEAAFRENKKLQLLHSGIQGWDHPVTSFSDKENYIKSFTYLMES